MIVVGVYEQVYRITNHSSDTMKISDSIRSTGQTLLGQLDKLQCDNHVLMSQSTEHYVRRLPIQTKRKLYIYFYLTLNIIYGFKYAILSFNDQDWTLALPGEYLYGFENIKLKSRIIFLVVLAISIGIIVVHYLESTHQLVHLHYIFNNISGRKDFVLSSNYQTIFVKRNMKYCTRLNQLNNFMKISHTFTSFILQLITYFITVKQNLLISLINNFGLILLGRYSYPMLFTLLIWSYMITIYIQLRFATIIEMIISNLLLVKRAILNYDNTYRMLLHLTKSFNIFLSIIYIYYPIFYGFMLNIIIDKNTSTNVKFILYLTNTMNFIVNYIIYDQMSSISTTNTSILMNLYPILVDKNFKKLKLRLRIDSFIARLNTEYIGFHCLLFIKLKRLAFYEYLIGLTGTCCLLSKTVNIQLF